MASAEYIKDLEEANRQMTAALQEQQRMALQQIRDESARQQQALALSREEALRAFEDSAQTAYLQKMLARRELPELLYQQGYTGGLTESALIRLENQYGQAYREANRAYANANTAYNSQLSALRNSEASQIAESDRSYAQKYADLAYTFQKERAKALEEQRAAELKAAAEAAKQAAKASSGSSKGSSSSASTSKQTGTAKNTLASVGGYVTKRARAPKEIYYSLF